MSYTKKAIKGFSIVFFISIISAFVGYLIRIVLARNLSVAEYGLFFSVFTMISFLAIFNNLGVPEALVKFVSEFLVKKKFNQIKSLIIISFLAQVLTGFILAIVLFFLSNFLAKTYFKTQLAVPVILWFILILFLYNLRTLVKNIYQAFQRMVTYALMYLIENILILVIILFFLIFRKGIFIAIYSHILAYVIILIFFTAGLFKVFNFLEHKFIVKKKDVKGLFKFGLSIMFKGLGAVIILYTDTLILTYFRSLEEVGIYNVVVPTVMMLMFFTNSIAAVIFPMVSELWTRKKKDYLVKGLEMLEKYSFVIIMPTAIILFAFSRIILSLMFGQAYASGSTAMQVLLIGIIFLSIYSIYQAAMAGIGKPEIPTKVYLQGALLNFLLNLLVIPKLGMIGAAITSLIAYFYIFIRSVFNLRRLIKVSMPWLSWLKIFISGLVMLGLILIITYKLYLNIYVEAILACLIGGLVYLGLIIIFRIISIDEVKNFLKLFLKENLKN